MPEKQHSSRKRDTQTKRVRFYLREEAQKALTALESAFDLNVNKIVNNLIIEAKSELGEEYEYEKKQ